MEIPQKRKRTKIEISFDPATSLLGYLKESKLVHKKDSCMPHVYCNTVHNNQNTESAEGPVKR
jgi:hypothetical protein